MKEQQHGTVMLWDVLAKDHTVVAGSLQPHFALFLAAAAACEQHAAVLAASRREQNVCGLVLLSVQQTLLIMS